MNEKNTFVAWLGYKGTPDFLKSRTIGGFVGVVILLFTLTVFAFAAIGLVKALSLYAFGDSTEDPSAAIRNIGLLLVGLLGAPFVAWQAIVRQKQVDIADDVLFNDKLNDANNDLHARYQTSEKQKDDTYVNIWKDDIIRRNGAIDRLAALAVERPSMAPRIARMLCVYLREMTRDYPAEGMPEGLEGFELWRWANDLEVKRSDMETAAQVVGRLHELTQVPAKELSIDLSGVNLQAMNLSELNFEHATLNGSALDGADLIRVRCDHATLIAASLKGACLEQTSFNGSKLSWADLNTANLIMAKFNEASLHGATLIGAKIYGATFNGAELSSIILDENTSLGREETKNAALNSIDLTNIQELTGLVTSTFGDASVKLPDDIQHLVRDRWPAETLSYSDFLDEWERFKKDPEAYVPPEPF